MYNKTVLIYQGSLIFFMNSFEKKVYDNLIDCGVSHTSRLGVAVSGGADSVSLLLALSEILKTMAGSASPLYVITVNHNIRPAEESRGDADYVLSVCEKLSTKGYNIVCEVTEFEPGAVSKEAQSRGGGIEDAARSLRYAAFDSFIKKHSLDAVCLAHNKNDQLETLLMRFLQGSAAEASGGIKARRGNFVRPLLNIPREDIEKYVTERGFTWRTDKTNSDTDYLRNKIRHKLIPFLDSEFAGWKTAVLAGAEKAQEDSILISSFMAQIPLSHNSDGSVSILLKDFLASPEALKHRILLEACNAAGETSRIPHQFLKDVISSLCESSDKNYSKRFGNIEICCKKDSLLVKKYHKDNTDLVFSDIIEKSGDFEFPFGILSVFNIEESANGKTASVSVSGKHTSTAEKISLPFLIRSIQLDDMTLCADGSEKKVSDILSDWHVSSEHRPLVPVIQILNEKSQRIKCVLAGFLGYKDWIVKL